MPLLDLDGRGTGTDWGVDDASPLGAYHVLYFLCVCTVIGSTGHDYIVTHASNFQTYVYSTVRYRTIHAWFTPFLHRCRLGLIDGDNHLRQGEEVSC